MAAFIEDAPEQVLAAAKELLEKGLVEGTSLLPGIDVRGHLLSVRRSGDHLFLRFELP